MSSLSPMSSPLDHSYFGHVTPADAFHDSQEESDYHDHDHDHDHHHHHHHHEHEDHDHDHEHDHDHDHEESLDEEHHFIPTPSSSANSSPASSPNLSARSKRHVCQECRKDFRNSVGLKRHMRVHTGERPYSCKTCGSRFSYVGNLSRHMRIHTGERPFLCAVCEKAFGDDSHRRTHERKVHGYFVKKQQQIAKDGESSFQHSPLAQSHSHDSQGNLVSHQLQQQQQQQQQQHGNVLVNPYTMYNFYSQAAPQSGYSSPCSSPQHPSQSSSSPQMSRLGQLTPQSFSSYPLSSQIGQMGQSMNQMQLGRLSNQSSPQPNSNSYCFVPCTPWSQPQYQTSTTATTSSASSSRIPSIPSSIDHLN